MSELEKIIKRYFSKDGKAIVYYDIDEGIFNKVIENIGKYERPDILSIFDNNIVGIEHFEFDSSDKSKKGSDFKIKDNIIEQKMDLKIKEELSKKNFVKINEKIDINSSLSNYFSNFKDVFIKHYNKIDEYIKHIKEDFDSSDKEISICFFADDVSPLGSYFLDKNSDICLLNPLYSDEIITLLKNSPKIRYLIIGTYAMSEYKLIIIENNEKSLNRFKEERQVVSEKEFFAFSPNTTGFATIIPRDSKE